MAITPSGIDEVIAMMSDSFPVDVVASIKRARFTMDDLLHLTRDDINSEFKTFRFGIRKSLWRFFSAFATNNDDKEMGSPVTNRTSLNESLAPRGTTDQSAPSTDDRVGDASHGEEFVLTVIGENTSREKVDIPETLDELVSDTVDSMNADKDGLCDEPQQSIPEGSYPGNIPMPFPFSHAVKKFLAQGEVHHDKYQYQHFLTEVCDILWECLRRKPTIAEIRVVEENLCSEYPVLRSNCNRTKSRFYQSLRKKINNRTRLTHKVESSIGSGQKLAGSAGDFKATLMAVDCEEEMSVATIELSYDSEDQPDRASTSGWRSGSKSKMPSYIKQYLQPPAVLMDEKEKEPYPGNIPSPFPLSDCCKKFLTTSSRKLFVENRFIYLLLVREISHILHRNLNRRPALPELKAVAKNLAIEYPILQCEGKSNSYTLYYSLRKKMVASRIFKLGAEQDEATKKEKTKPCKVEPVMLERRGRKRKRPLK